MAVTDTIIRFTTSTKPTITVKENQINNTSTSLLLYGKSTLIPSKFINTNLLYILENFCNDRVPFKPIEGQIWCDTSDASAKNETGRLKINIKDSTTSVNFHDIAGTVMNEDGNLRHLGQIEAVNEYNSIDQAHKDVYPEDVEYKKYLTSKKHCDENYLSGDYSTDNSKFNVRGDRKIKTPTVITFTAPGTYDDDRYKLINKQYLDQKFLTGQNFNDHFIIPTDKKLYYSSECVIDLPYQLITKKYCLDQDTAARVILDALSQDATDGLEKYVLEAEAAAEAARLAAEAAWAAVNSVPPQTTPATLTITGANSCTGTTTTTTTPITMMDVSIPTVNSYTGINTHPIIDGLMSTEPALGASTTYTITIDGTAVPQANITVTPVTGKGVIWSVDTTYLNWVKDTSHTVVVTRIEDPTHSFVSTSNDQIHITSLIIPTVDIKTISVSALNCTITGTIGTSGFAAAPDVDSIKVVFNALTYYRYNTTNTNDSSKLTVSPTGVWTLADVPTPSVGSWDVVVTRNDNPLQIDNTTNEITVASLKDSILPTVEPQTLKGTGTELTNVTVTGKVGFKNLTDSVSTFDVVVTDSTNAVVAGTLTVTGVDWTYTIPTISTGKTYNVVATRTDEYNNTFVDNTTDELIVQKVLDAALPTVVTTSVVGGALVEVTGTVGSINLADSSSTFTVIVKNTVAPYVEEVGTLTYDATGINWTLTLTNVPEGEIYNVTATRTDAYNNTFVDETSGELTVTVPAPVFTGTFTTDIVQLGLVNGVNTISIVTNDTTAGSDIKSKSYAYTFSTYTVSGTTINSNTPASPSPTVFKAPRDNTVIIGDATLVITFNNGTTTSLSSEINYSIQVAPPANIDPAVDGYYVGDFNGYKLYYAPKATAQFKVMENVFAGSRATSVDDGYTNCQNLSVRSELGYKTPGSAWPAVYYCWHLDLGGHQWYLPSVNELKFIWANRSKLPAGQGLGSNAYSTSTRNGGDFFWYMASGVFQNKGTLRGIVFTMYARALRRVPI